MTIQNQQAEIKNWKLRLVGRLQRISDPLQRAWRWGQPLLLVAGFVLIGWFTINQWRSVRDDLVQIQPIWFAFSALLMLLSWWLEIQIWRLLLQSSGNHLPFVAALRIWFLSAIVRYVPGNVWQPLSMVMYCRQWNIRAESTVTSIVFYQIINLMAITLLTALYFLTIGNWGLLASADWLATGLVLIGALAVLIVLLRSHWLLAILNWLLGLLGRQQLEAILSRRTLFCCLALALVEWLAWGATFATLTFGLHNYSLAQMLDLTPHLIASFGVAFAIGLLSVITPSGLGVREGALYLLLAPLLGGGLTTLAALVMRLWMTVGEVIMAAISYWLGESTSVSMAKERLDGA